MDKRALVTGASEGIGRAFAKKLAGEGFKVTVVARTEAKLKSLVQEMGTEHCQIVADLSTEAGQKKVCEELESHHYDLLVNNAGVGTYGPFTDVSLDRQVHMMRLNCEAVMRLAHTFLKNSEPGDALINTSSTLAFLPLPMSGLYSATKAFVTSFSESLWFEQKARGVYVMGLCPGITETNFHINSGGRAGELPKALAQTSEQVVEAAMKALAARKNPTVISGVKNFMMASFARAMPRKSTVSMMGKMASQKNLPLT